MSKNDPHILGKESIGKLLLQYSIPAIIGMTITSISVSYTHLTLPTNSLV